MLNDAVGFSAVYIMTGYTDLRSGIDRLAALVESKTDVNPCQPNTLYLFCGRRTDRIKGLVWEKDGWLLLYKRLAAGSFQWPRNEVSYGSAISLVDGGTYDSPSQTCNGNHSHPLPVLIFQKRSKSSHFVPIFLL